MYAKKTILENLIKTWAEMKILGIDWSQGLAELIEVDRNNNNNDAYDIRWRPGKLFTDDWIRPPGLRWGTENQARVADVQDVSVVPWI